MKNYFIHILAVIFLLLISCDKSKESMQDATAYVNVKISDASYANFSNSKLGSLSSNNTAELIIPWNEDIDVIVRLNNNVDSKLATRSLNTKTVQVIDKDVHYRLLVFNSKNEFVVSKDYVVGQESGNGIPLSSAEKYSFIVYSFGEKSKLPYLNMNTGESMDKALLSLTSIKDVMLDTRIGIQLSVGQNNLGLTLKHQFSEVNVKINTEDVGNVEAVGDLHISNVFPSAVVDMSKSSSFPKNLSFTSKTFSQTLEPFQKDEKGIYSNSNIVYANAELTNVLTLEKLKIGGVQKENLDLFSFVAKPGVSYTIEIVLKSKGGSLEGFNDGTLIWANGNLIKIGEDQYAFAASQGEYGDYWYRSNDGLVYSNPMTIQNKSSNTGVPVDNICGKVGAGWRLPTEKDVFNLEKYVDWYGKSNKAFGAYVKPDGTSVQGIYIGTNKIPSVADQDKYLFLPAAGAYNSGSPAEVNQSCFYWHSGNVYKGESTSFQIASYYFSPNNDGGKDLSRTNSVRCVKDVK
jgi:uncharacterized protein (TIGR02145 family)